MIRKDKYPILEFDNSIDAVINPADDAGNISKFDCNKLIIAFFGEALQKLIDINIVKPYSKIRGENPFNILSL